MNADVTELLKQNAECIKADMNTLWSIAFESLKTKSNTCADIVFPFHGQTGSTYSAFIHKHKLSGDDRLLLILALAPHLAPDFFDTINLPGVMQDPDSNYHVYGKLPGVFVASSSTTFPTGLTFLSLGAGKDLVRRIELMRYLSSENIFSKEKIVSIEPNRKGEPAFSGRIVMTEKWIEYFTLGHHAHPNSIKLWAIEK